jgi:membrane dipeptidase
MDMIARIYSMIEDDEAFVLVTNKRDLDELRTTEKIGVIIALEGAEPLDNHLRFLPIFYKLGVRLITITWSRRNAFGDGCASRPEDETNYGLTALGKSLIKAMNRMGILIDVSHLNDAGFYDVIDLTESLIVASHSCARALVNSPRNLTDDQIQKIAETNGAIGVNFYPKFLTGDAEATIEDVIIHIDYICQLLGNADHVGLGSDFDGIRIVPTGLENTSKIKDIPLLLAEKGYRPEEITKIMGENWARVFGEVMKVGEY